MLAVFKSFFVSSVASSSTVGVKHRCFHTNFLLGDLIALLKNAVRHQRKTVVVPFSKLNLSVVFFLVRQGFLLTYVHHVSQSTLELTPAYSSESISPIRNIGLISKPSRFRYVKVSHVLEKAEELHPRRRVVVLSTSKGIMYATEAAKLGLGGVALFFLS